MDEICKMCAYHLGDDITCNKENCYEYMEFIVSPVYQAAPEMLEALKKLYKAGVNWHDSICNKSEDSWRYEQRFLNELNAIPHILSKAEGRQS
ncbi:MAG: hypothetical protein WCR27_10190 [Eubacteriales bacterium]